MFLLYLFEAVVVLSVLLLIAYLISGMIKNAQKNKAAELATAQMLSLDDARKIVLTHVNQLMSEQSLAYNQAVLAVMSTDYIPGISQPALPHENRQTIS